MMNLFLILLLVFLLVSTGFAQNSVEDLVRLRNRVGIEPSVTIVSGKAADFIKQANVKVYIATEKKSTRKSFLKWIDRWNKMTGIKYGNFVLTKSWNEADIILVSYDRKDEISPVPRTTINIFNPRRRIPSPAEKPRIENTLFFPIPTYSYILFQKSDRIEIFYGKVDRSHPEDGFDEAKELFNRLEKLMKF